MTIILLLASSFLFTFFGIELYRRWSLKKSILDIPNHRSSHTAPTPRGGGLIFVIVCLAGFVLINLFQPMFGSRNYFIGACLIAGVSWLDDIFEVNIVWRFLVHSAAAIIVLFGETPVYVPFQGRLELYWLEKLIWCLWIVWLINAYNFMDGIDGIAGMQAVTAAFGWSLLAYLMGAENAALYAAIIFISATAFLIHNWQPAKIFMGDVGSAFFGYTFAVIPLLVQLQTENESANAFENWFVAGTIFVFFFLLDSVLTIGKRIFKGEKIWQAHREHLYQKMVEKDWRHSSVTLIYGIFSITAVLTYIINILLNDKIGLLLTVELIGFSSYLIYQGWFFQKTASSASAS